MTTLTMAAVVIGTATAAVIDVRTRRIPNALTASVAGSGVLLAAQGWHELAPASALLGLALGAALLAPGYLLGATGAGDVKLLAAVGAWVGPALIAHVFLYSAIAGGVLAAIVALRRGRLGVSLRGVAGCLRAPARAQQEFAAADASRRFAYGPAIALATALTVLGF